MTDRKLDPDFADLPPSARAEIEGALGVGLHHAPEDSNPKLTGEAFHHPETDAVGTTWEPDWQPIETYRDGDVVMLDDGARQMLGRRVLGMWMELTRSEELAQPDFLPMLWSDAPEQVKYDLM